MRTNYIDQMIGNRSALAAAMTALLSLAACSTSSSGETDLTVTVIPDPSSEPEVWSLTCDPPGGNHPDPTAACALLDDLARSQADPFAPTPDDVACSQEYAGPSTATVTGTWLGDDVDASFSLVDGCEIARWTLAERLLVYPPFAN